MEYICFGYILFTWFWILSSLPYKCCKLFLWIQDNRKLDREGIFLVAFLCINTNKQMSKLKGASIGWMEIWFGYSIYVMFPIQTGLPIFGFSIFCLQLTFNYYCNKPTVKGGCVASSFSDISKCASINNASLITFMNQRFFLPASESLCKINHYNIVPSYNVALIQVELVYEPST